MPTDLTQLPQLLASGCSLTYFEGKLSLCHPDYEPLFIDFCSKQFLYREQFGGGFNEALAKACLAKTRPSIMDVTAGLGRDAYLLASLGAHVQMIERHPVIHALLADALKRLAQTAEPLALTLQAGDSQAVLSTLAEQPDVIYIDPMHPPRKKSALVKKEMRILRQLVGEDMDKAALITQALGCAKKRVVVKWPAKQPSVIAKPPTFSYPGKSIRFDVYCL